MTTRSATRPTPPDLRLPLHRDPVPTRTRLDSRRLPVLLYVAALLLVPAAVIAAAVGGGLWRTTGTSLTAAAATDGTPGETVAAPADPADVKGSMTVEQVAQAFPAVTAEQIVQAFGAPVGTPASTQLKTLVQDGDLDVLEFREWLAARL